MLQERLLKEIKTKRSQERRKYTREENYEIIGKVRKIIIKGCH